MQLLTGTQSRLYAYICSLIGGAAGARDVLQETNLVLWDKAQEYDPARPFLPWAYRIAYLQVLAYRKQPRGAGWSSMSNWSVWWPRSSFTATRTMTGNWRPWGIASRS